LPGEVHCERLGDGDHAEVGSHRARIADLVDRQEVQPRIVVDKIVELPRSQAVAGYDPVAVECLAPARHNTGFHQAHEAVGDDVAMNAEVTAVIEILQGFVWDAAQADLQGRFIVDDGCDIARDALCRLACRWMPILRHRRIDAYERVESVDVHKALAVRARHRRIDLGDDGPGDTQNSRRKVYRHSEAYKAARIGRRNLKQRHIDRQPAARKQPRHLL
jgi:hypothetical protein